MKLRHLFLFALFITMLAYWGDCNCISEGHKAMRECDELVRQGKFTSQDCRDMKAFLIEKGKI
jgi:hypothetical protein